MNTQKELSLNAVSSQYLLPKTEGFSDYQILNINESLLKCGLPGLINIFESIKGVRVISLSNNTGHIEISISTEFDNDSVKSSIIELIKCLKESYIAGNERTTYEFAVIVDEFTPHSPGLTTGDAIIEYCACRDIKIVGITGHNFIAKFTHSDYAQHMAIKKGKGGFCSDVYHVVEKIRSDLLPSETIDF